METCSGNHKFIKVSVDEKSYFIRVKPSDQLATLKKSVETLHGKSLDGYFFYDGHRNENLRHDIELYEINKTSRLHLVASHVQPFQIIIVTMTGKKAPIMITSFYTVEQVKKLLYEIECVPPDQQILLFNGKQIWNEKIVSDYNIMAGSRLQMVLRLRGC